MAISLELDLQKAVETRHETSIDKQKQHESDTDTVTEESGERPNTVANPGFTEGWRSDNFYL